MNRILIVMALAIVTACRTNAAGAGSRPASYSDEGSSDKKVRVYILAGQSNMEEKGSFKALAWQVTQPEYRERYTHLIKDGDYDAFTKIYNESIAKDKKKPVHNFGERKDVWMSNHGKHANLSPDYLKNNHKFGLEVNFGYEMGDRYDEQVLIIKTAWGGRSLERGFRPPSEIPGEDALKSEWDKLVADREAKKEKAIEQYPKRVKDYENQLAQYEKAKADGTLKKKQGPPRKPQDPNTQDVRGPKTFEEYKASYGIDYRNMMKEVKAALANIKKNHPSYQDQGYEIKGFVWFQGFNDMFADDARDNYAKRLVALIKDVKKELNAPDLQTVIGQMGHGGDLDGMYQEKKNKATGEVTMSSVGMIRKAQLDASQDPDVKDSTALVRTAPFWDMEAHAVYTGPGGWSKNFQSWLHFGGDFPYHYYASPWFFSQAGTAFAKAMIALEDKAK